MKRRSTIHQNVDHVTLEFLRVSSQFFGPLSTKFIRKQSRRLSPAERKKVLLAWASIGRHPEPQNSWAASCKRNPRVARRFWKEVRALALSNGHSAFRRWTQPHSWPQLEKCLASSGYQIFPIISAFGPELEEFLADEKILAFVPRLEDEGLFTALRRALGGQGQKAKISDVKLAAIRHFEKGQRTDHNRRELNYHLGLMKDLTYYFSTAAFRNFGVTSSLQKALLDDQRILVEDRDPDRTLLETAKVPVPFDRVGLVKNPISPGDKWGEVYKSASTWPREVQNAAAPLLDRGGRLPDWKSLTAFSRNLGFKAVPILGWVGGPVYTRMLAQREFPICSFWVMRYRTAPRHIVAVDALHDIGHGLSMAMPDYRELCVQFSKKTLGWSEYLNSTRYLMDYIRFFELGYAANPDGTAEAIGPVSFGLETFDFDGKRLYVPKENQEIDKPYQFRSRDAWRQEVEHFIRDLSLKRVRNLKLEPSPRVYLK